MSWSTNLWELGKGNNLFLQEPGAHKHHCNAMHCNHHHLYIVGSVQNCEYTSQFGSLEFFTSFLWIFSTYALQGAWGRPSRVARDELHAEDKPTSRHMPVIIIIIICICVCVYICICICREFFLQFHCGARLTADDTVEKLGDERRNLYNQFRSWKSLRRKRLMRKMQWREKLRHF